MWISSRPSNPRTDTQAPSGVFFIYELYAAGPIILQTKGSPMLLTAIIVLAVLLVVLVYAPPSPRYAIPGWLIALDAALLGICLLLFVLNAIAPGSVPLR